MEEEKNTKQDASEKPEDITSHEDETVILPRREEEPPEEPAAEVEPEPEPEPEPDPEPVVEESPVEPISMTPEGSGDEPVVPDLVEGAGGNDSRKKWIIIAVVVVILLCCCCLVAAVALSWEGIVDAVEDIMFHSGPALAWLHFLSA